MRGGRAPGAVVAVSLALLALVGAVAVPEADDEGAVIAILAAAAVLSIAGGWRWSGWRGRRRRGWRGRYGGCGRRGSGRRRRRQGTRG